MTQPARPLLLVFKNVQEVLLDSCPCWSLVKREDVPSEHDDIRVSCVCIFVNAEQADQTISWMQQYVRKNKGSTGFVLVVKNGRVRVVSSCETLAVKLSRSLQLGTSSLLHALSRVVLGPEYIQEGQSVARSWQSCKKCRHLSIIDHAPEESGLWSTLRPREVVEAVTSNLPQLLPLNPGRSTVYNKEELQVRGVHFCLLVRRGRGISAAEYKYPEALRAIHMLAECRPVNHEYLAVQVNLVEPPNSMPEHRDERNHGDT